MSTATGFHGQNREVGKEHRYPANRLKSIAADAEVTDRVIRALNHGRVAEEEGTQGVANPTLSSVPSPPPTFPTIVNLRCGAWYVPPESRGGTAYFKSTDGHYGRWAFSFTRLNLHLLANYCLREACATSTERRGQQQQKQQQHIQSHGFILVDATQQGKRFPDALSKTVPFWVGVLNQALYYRGSQKPQETEKTDKVEANQEEEDVAGSAFSSNFPSFVPRNEIIQMEKLLPEMVEQFFSKGCAALLQQQHGEEGEDGKRTEEISTFKLAKPMKCFHISCNDAKAVEVAAQYHADFFQPSKKDGVHQQQQLRADLPFTPIFCLSASGDRDRVRPRGGWAYVAGAGDDHQSWSKGLDDAMFWRHVAALTDSVATHSEIERLMDRIVGGDGDVEGGDDTEEEEGEGETEGSAAGGRNKVMKHRTRVQTVPTASMMAGSNNTEAPEALLVGLDDMLPTVVPTVAPPAAIGPPCVASAGPLLLIPTSWLAFELWFTEKRREQLTMMKSSSRRSGSTEQAEKEEEKESFSSCLTFDLFLLQLENVPTPDPSASDVFLQGAAGVKLHHFMIDENAKFGLERSLTPVLSAARTAYNCSGGERTAPRTIVLLSGDVSVTAVVAVAITALFAGENKAAASVDPFTLNFHQGLAAASLSTPTEGSSNITANGSMSGEELSPDLEKKANGHLVAQTKPEWLQYLLFPKASPPAAAAAAAVSGGSSSTSTPTVSVVSKAKIQWAQRFVVNQLASGVFPSRVHMKQLSRYFLTPDRVAPPSVGKETRGVGGDGPR